jgi:hypothetical protein
MTPNPLNAADTWARAQAPLVSQAVCAGHGTELER